MNGAWGSHMIPIWQPKEFWRAPHTYLKHFMIKIASNKVQHFEIVDNPDAFHSRKTLLALSCCYKLISEEIHHTECLPQGPIARLQMQLPLTRAFTGHKFYKSLFPDTKTGWLISSKNFPTSREGPSWLLTWAQIQEGLLREASVLSSWREITISQ